MRLLPRGVADQDVEPAQPRDRVRDQLLAKSLVAQVAGQGKTLAPGPVDQRQHLPRIGVLGRKKIDGASAPSRAKAMAAARPSRNPRP